MFGIHDLPLFAVAAVLLNLTPGPDTLFVVSQAPYGPRAGAAAAAGIGVGCLVHILAASLGLSALLMASATAFAVVKGVGALYLVWIGLSMLFARPARPVPAGAPVPADSRPPRLRRIFLRGALTNALNPKVAMFFLAFLPQFIETSAPHRALGFLLLGAFFNITGTIWNLSLGWLAAGALARRPATARAAAWFGRGVGAVFVGLGVKLAFGTRAPG